MINLTYSELEKDIDYRLMATTTVTEQAKAKLKEKTGCEFLNKQVAEIKKRCSQIDAFYSGPEISQHDQVWYANKIGLCTEKISALESTLKTTPFRPNILTPVELAYSTVTVELLYETMNLTKEKLKSKSLEDNLTGNAPYRDEHGMER
jgi:hypothetical protein